MKFIRSNIQKYSSESYWFYIDIFLILIQFFVIPVIFQGMIAVSKGGKDPFLGNIFLFVFVLEFIGWLFISKTPLPRGSRKNLDIIDIFIWMCHIACDMVMVFWGLQALGYPISAEPESPNALVLFLAFFAVVAKSLFWFFRLLALDTPDDPSGDGDTRHSMNWNRFGADTSMGLYSIVAFLGIWGTLAPGIESNEFQPGLRLLYGLSTALFFFLSFVGSRAWNLILQIRSSSVKEIMISFFYMPVINIFVALWKLFS